jgi:hypothetical protein
MKVVILTLLAAFSAFAQKIAVEFDEGADFSKYKTFAIRDGVLNSKNPALNSELVKKRIDADIERGLTAKGLAKVAGPSDLNVRYRFGSARRAELENYPAGWRGLEHASYGCHTPGARWCSICATPAPGRWCGARSRARKKATP